MEVPRFYDVHPGSDFWKHNYHETTEGYRIHYVRDGSGIPVLLLHGWPGFWYDWRHVIPGLSTKFDVVAPDLLGFGYSDKPDAPTSALYGPDAQEARLLELMDQLGIEKFVVAGYDVGSGLAQKIARSVPDRVHSIVLFNPPYPGIGERRFAYAAQKEFWYQHFHNIGGMEKLIGYNRDTVKLYLAHFYEHWVGRKDKVREKEFEGIVDVYSQPNAVGTSIGWYRSGSGTGLASPNTGSPVNHTQPIARPTYVLLAELDPVLPAAWFDRLQTFFSDMKVKHLPDVGHFVPFEAPEEIIGAIEEMSKGVAP
jgi:pimeloyl-ACP methyl ester carboxylesterase